MDRMNEVVVEQLPGEPFARTRALARYDQDEILKVIGRDLQEEYQVEFALHRCGTVAETVVGTPAGVEVPEWILAANTRSIFARIVKEDGTSRKILLEIEIPVTDRPVMEKR